MLDMLQMCQELAEWHCTYGDTSRMHQTCRYATVYPCPLILFEFRGCHEIYWTSRDVMDMHQPSSHPQGVTQGWGSDVTDVIPDIGPFLRVLQVCQYSLLRGIPSIVTNYCYVRG